MKDENEIEDIDCTEAIDQLYAYLDGEINDDESIEKVEHHLQHCHSCFTRSQLEGLLTERMRLAASKQAPDSLQDRVRKLIDELD
jgi:anti-sigma factor (TIGR02949 family)